MTGLRINQLHALVIGFLFTYAVDLFSQFRNRKYVNMFVGSGTPQFRLFQQNILGRTYIKMTDSLKWRFKIIGTFNIKVPLVGTDQFL